MNSLVAYGLTPIQTQVFITLLKMGGASARAVSSSSDVSRMNVYRALRRLSNLGLVEKGLGDPTEFIPVEIDEALDMMVDLRARETKRLEAMKPELSRRLQLVSLDGPVNRHGNEQPPLFLKAISGEHVFKKVKTLITGAKKDVMKIFSPRSAILYERIGLPEIEEQRRRAGVKIRGVTTITKENASSALNYSKVIELRHSDDLSSHLRYTVVDRSLLLLPVGVPPEDVDDATALWTNSSTLISGLLDDFEKLWRSSVDASTKIEALESTTIV